VLRSIRSESKSRRDHLSVFREFLDYFDRVTRSRAARPRATGTKTNGETRSRRSSKS
jgi:hypothetical protein